MSVDDNVCMKLDNDQVGIITDITYTVSQNATDMAVIQLGSDTGTCMDLYLGIFPGIKVCWNGDGGETAGGIEWLNTYWSGQTNMIVSGENVTTVTWSAGSIFNEGDQTVYVSSNFSTNINIL